MKFHREYVAGSYDSRWCIDIGKTLKLGRWGYLYKIIGDL